MHPLIVRRQLELAVPPAAPEALMRAVADELGRNGSIIGSVERDRVEFTGPDAFHPGASRERRAAGMVERGIVWLDPTLPRLNLELRIGLVHFLWPALISIAVVMMDTDVVFRAVGLAAIAGITWRNLATARRAFEGWVERGAGRC
jgi:hypothetical protein